MTTTLLTSLVRSCETKLPWRTIINGAAAVNLQQPRRQIHSNSLIQGNPKKVVGHTTFSRTLAMAKTATDLSSEVAKQNYDYFLVLDFEATCDRIRTVQPQEIIEFPCLKLNGKTLEVESHFHQYVQPRVNRELTSFCVELTGINQDMLNNQPDIEVTLKQFDQWLQREGLLKDDVKFTFVTCGDWDLDIMLPNECSYFKVEVPQYMRSWINIKKPFVNVTGIWPKGLLHMMSVVGMQHEGRLHNGFDDCRNLAKVFKHLGQKGFVFDVTGLHDY